MPAALFTKFDPQAFLENEKRQGGDRILKISRREMLSSVTGCRSEIRVQGSALLNLLNPLKLAPSIRRIVVPIGALRTGEPASTNARAFWSMTAACCSMRPKSKHSSTALLNG